MREHGANHEARSDIDRLLKPRNIPGQIFHRVFVSRHWRVADDSLVDQRSQMIGNVRSIADVLGMVRMGHVPHDVQWRFAQWIYAPEWPVDDHHACLTELIR